MLYNSKNILNWIIGVYERDITAKGTLKTDEMHDGSNKQSSDVHFKHRLFVAK